MLEAYDDLRVPIRALLGDLQVDRNEQLVEELNGVLLGSVATQIAYPDTIETMTDLKQKYTLVLLTNTFKQGYEGLKEKFGVETIFDDIITSFEAHHIKPDPEPFKRAIQSTACDVSEIVVVGDNLHDDIVPAHNVGLNAILLDRKGRYPDFEGRITTLAEVQVAIDGIDRAQNV